MKLSIDLSKRKVFIGKTGSGKTFLAKTMMQLVSNTTQWPIIIIDSPDHYWYKQADPPRSGPGTVDAPRLITDGRLHDMQKIKVQIYQPGIPGYKDAALLSLLRQVYDRRNCLIYFDEIVGIVDPSHFPEEFMTLWAQGRKINIAAWAAMQRPMHVPEMVMSQAEDWYVFRTPGITDRQKIAGYLNTPAIAKRMIPPRQFWYFGADSDEAHLMREISVTYR